MDKAVYILIGLPGSGKTTFAKSIFGEDVYKSNVVSTDFLLEEMAERLNISYNDAFSVAYKQAEKLAKQTFRRLLKNKEMVIWDQTNVSKKKRTTILNQIPKGYKRYAIVFEIEGEILKNRLEERERETGKRIPEHVIKRMGESFETPTREEGFDKIFKIRGN